MDRVNWLVCLLTHRQASSLGVLRHPTIVYKWAWVPAASLPGFASLGALQLVLMSEKNTPWPK